MDAKRLIAAALGLLLFPSVYAQDGAYDPTFGVMGRSSFDVTPDNYNEASKMIRLPNGEFFMGGLCTNAFGSQSSSPACAAWITDDGRFVFGIGPGLYGVSFSAFAGWPSDAYGIKDAAALPNGRVIVMSPQTSGSGTYLALVRADGKGLDTSIGNGAGYIIPNLRFNALRLTSGQKIVAVGETSTRPYAFLAVRFTADFKLDTTFGSGGSMTLGFPDGDASAFSAALQRDGKIVVGGRVDASDGMSSKLAIARFTADGQPDPTFGPNSDGRFENNFSYTFSSATDITLDKKGRIIFAGGVGPANNGAFPGQWIVGRLRSGGAIDADFNGAQPQIFTIANSSSAYSPQACCVALQSDGQIVVAGTMYRPDSGDGAKYFGLARFNTDGTFDDTFGGGGESYGDLSDNGTTVASDSPMSLIIVGGGIVLGGYTKLKNGEERFSAAKEMIDLLFADDFE